MESPPTAASSWRPGVLNIGFTRYTLPLDDTERKKFDSLAHLARFHVVGLSSNWRRHHHEESAHFYLLPLLPLAGLRFLGVCVYSLVLGARLCGAGQVEILLCQGPYEALVGLILRHLLGVFGRKVVLVTELHGDWKVSPFLYRGVPMARLLRRPLGAWAAFVIRRSDLLRTISSFLRDRAKEIAPDVPCVVFPTYTNFELFLSGSVDERSHDRSGPILFVGALYPIKGISHLLRAMRTVGKEHPPAHLNVIGDGPLRVGLVREAAALGIGERVSFLGGLSQPLVRDRLHQSSLLVLPSLAEGLGRVIVEAMACGLPVVASEVGGIPDLVDDGETGFLVPPGDERALAEKILWLLRNPESARRMGQKGAARAREKFSTGRYVEGYASVFEFARVLLGGEKAR